MKRAQHFHFLLRQSSGVRILAWLVFLFPPGAHGQDTYAQAKIAFQQGEYATASELFETAEKNSPEATDSLLYATKCYVNLRRFVDAENALRRFIAVNSKSPDAAYLLGYVLNRENRPKESLEIYTKAAAMTPPTGDDLKIVALDYTLLNDNADAIRWLERSVALDGNNVEAWYFLGRCYYTASRLTDARKAFEKVLELDSHNAKAENNLGLIAESSGKTDEALTAYRNSIAWQEGEKHQSEQPYLNLGGLLITEDRPEEAIAPLQKAVELASSNAQCKLRLGIAYMRVGRLAEAQKELEAAVRLDPSDAAAHYQLGRYYKEIKRMDAAQAEFARVAELQSKAVEEQKKPLE
jgi:tetratricopeptide (TPR) repeat protein